MITIDKVKQKLSELQIEELAIASGFQIRHRWRQFCSRFLYADAIQQFHLTELGTRNCQP